MLSDRKPDYIGAERGDSAGEFVTKGYGEGLACDGMGSYGYKCWAAEIFVEIWFASVLAACEIRGGTV